MTVALLRCTASPEDKKPAFCSQKYVGHISMATEELHAALNSYSNMHGKAIEMARQEVVEFYQARSLELDSTLQEQQKVIHSLEQAMGKLGDQLTAKTLELTRTTENLKREQKAGKQAEKAAEESKVRIRVSFHHQAALLFMFCLGR